MVNIFSKLVFLSLASDAVTGDSESDKIGILTLKSVNQMLDGMSGLDSTTRKELSKTGRELMGSLIHQTSPAQSSTAPNTTAEDNGLPLHIRTLCWRPKHFNPNVAGQGHDEKITYNVPTEAEYNDPKNYVGWCKNWLSCIENKAPELGCSKGTEFIPGGEDSCSKAVIQAWGPPSCDQWCSYHEEWAESEGEVNSEKELDMHLERVKERKESLDSSSSSSFGGSVPMPLDSIVPQGTDELLMAPPSSSMMGTPTTQGPITTANNLLRQKQFIKKSLTLSNRLNTRVSKSNSVRGPMSTKDNRRLQTQPKSTSSQRNTKFRSLLQLSQSDSQSQPKPSLAYCKQMCESMKTTIGDCVAESMFYPAQLRQEKKEKPYSFGVKTGGCYMSVFGTFQATDPSKITGRWMGSSNVPGSCGMRG